MAVAGSLLVICLFVIKFCYQEKYQTICETIQGKIFILPELYFIGFALIDLFKIKLDTPRQVIRKQRLIEVYGAERAAFYQYAILGGQVTYFIISITLGLLFGAMMNDLFVGASGIVGAILLVAYFQYEIKRKVVKRREALLADFLQVVAALALLTNAGLTLREAWIEVWQSGSGIMHQEMKMTTIEIQNGTAEVDAFNHLAKRCVVKEIRKLASVIVQHLHKGGVGIAHSLIEMSYEVWQEKKSTVKKKGELISQKLLLPIGMMFIGILLMIVIPVFSSII